MSARENIAINIQRQLENMTDPAPGLVSRVFFGVSRMLESANVVICLSELGAPSAVV